MPNRRSSCIVGQVGVHPRARRAPSPAPGRACRRRGRRRPRRCRDDAARSPPVRCRSRRRARCAAVDVARQRLDQVGLAVRSRRAGSAPRTRRGRSRARHARHCGLTVLAELVIGTQLRTASDPGEVGAGVVVVRIEQDRVQAGRAGAADVHRDRVADVGDARRGRCRRSARARRRRCADRAWRRRRRGCR